LLARDSKSVTTCSPVQVIGN